MAMTGFVFDTYDDFDGEVLREIIPDISNVPDFVKQAHRITQDEERPDDSYALVLIKEGRQFPKYATVDKGNTALSVMYLLKQAHLLPAKAVKIAAHNLMEACGRFELEVPEQLKIAAASGVSGVSGKSQQPFLRKMLNAVLEKQTEYPVPEPDKETTIEPVLGRGGVEDDVKRRTNMKSVMGENFLQVPPFSLKEQHTGDHLKAASVGKVKTAGPADAATMALLDHPAATHEKLWRTSPYVDMQDWEPGATLEKQASAPPVRTLLRGKYPVDDYGQVKTAEAYFSEYTRKFHPRDRRVYCVKLAQRMTELDIDVPDNIAKYASSTYGADVEAYVSFRKSHVHEEFHPALDTLMEKQSMVSPETFAEALCEFDEFTKLSLQWDSRIPDPWTSTFGDSLEKVAADEWVFDEQGVRLDESDLKELSSNNRELVVSSFGEKFADQFAGGPKTFFNALPTPNKLVLGRMVMDRHGV